MERSSSVVILTLPQVIDAALGRPELGFVSYGLLSNILRVMCQELNLDDLRVQYRGAQAEQLQKIWDPKVKTEIPGVVAPKEKKTSIAVPAKDEKMVVIPDKDVDEFPTMTLAISQSQLDTMVNDIKNLQEEVADLKALPSNSDLFMAVKSKAGEPTPLIDMYQILSITKRVDAIEKAIMKMASYVEDLTKFVQGEEEAFKEVHESYESRKRETQMDQSVDQMMNTDKFSSAASTIPASSTIPAAPTILAAPTIPEATSPRVFPLKPLDISFPTNLIPSSLLGSQDVQKFDDDWFSDFSSEPVIETKPAIESEPVIETKSSQSTIFDLPKSKMDDVEVCDMPNREAFKLVQTELKNLKVVTVDLMKKSRMIPTNNAGKPQQGQTRNPIEIERKIARCVAQINKIDSAFTVSYTGVTNRLADLEESMKLVFDKAINQVEKVDFEEQLSLSVYSLNERVKELESTVTKIDDIVSGVVEDFETDQSKMTTALEDIENIKSDKIGRQEFVEALAEKVDLCMVNRKVSHDQFNATCDDLSKGIEEALEKLVEQEELWHVALKEIQEEISVKLCKDDLQPLENFVTEKLKALQHKMKTLAKLKRDQEAAATKRKFLRDVQCISCDKDVIMRTNMDVSVHLPSAPAIASHKSIAPYLAYELDQLRKQQQQVQYGKNLHHFEAAMQDNKNIINRYCGGQHTITTPQQRVSRPGNFIEQWGPKAISADENSNIRKPGNINTGDQKKPTNVPITVRSAIKPIEPEKDEDIETKM